MRNTAAPVSLPARYRVDGPVASGGMASVWAAHDTLLDRPVAVKILAEHLNDEPAARERFQREARAAAAISSHAGVATIYDVGEHGGRSFIVMELFSGGTVADRLRSGDRPRPPVALAWLRDAGAALDAAHQRGIVHRDIKPANLLLDEKGRLAVADFGIARLAWEDSVTQTGQVLGTAAYLSPEQAQGEMATDASDRYALAVVAFELLTGTKPFNGEHFAAQARAHIEEPPPRASARERRLPAAVDDVLARGMAKDPAARWATAVEFVEALEKACAGPAPPRTAATQAMGGAPASEGRTPRAAAAAAPPPPAPPAARALYRARFPVALALILVGLALTAIVLAAVLGGEEPRTRTPRAQPTQQATAEPTAEPTQEATAEPTQSAPSGDDPAALNAQGFELFQNEQYAESVPFFQKAVEACGDSGALDPCGYALYNLGAALNRSGNPQEAIPILQQRLERFDNQQGVVKKELRDACEAAGQGKDCGGNGNEGRGGDDD